MKRKSTGQTSNTNPNQDSQYGFFNLLRKPIEIYVFIDPLCPKCWSLEPILKKLKIEYGHYFKIRPIVSGKLENLNVNKLNKAKNIAEIWEKTASRTGMSCDGDVWLENPISSPWLPSLAIKAAELQGRKSGTVFLRKLQEHLFVNKKDISQEHILIQCAKEAQLDVEEFQNDLHDDSAKKALQCDVKLTHEMEIDQLPAIVFFNQLEEQEGIKVTGLYTYEVYVKVLTELLGQEPKLAPTPSLEEFMKHYQFVAAKEISVVFDWTSEKTEKEMKKLLIKQIVEKIPAKYGTFWLYKEKR
ncbi:ClpXP adapter SpxH family protein [Salirhabdus sp. Marseille-P4669]|uniref:ClpXP adapter SpxH family protein n=1 Tax=Salirhabdus sp. Marseille-P4669 TaxID=2042310 RepID=UPI000C7B6B04|nr:ClpXP adapter SpxH family protein [Salirhabdus sp. Marseille-P4669]